MATPVRIGGTLYPSQEWYDKNVASKSANKSATEAKNAVQTATPSDMSQWESTAQQTITNIQEQIPKIQAGLQELSSGQGGDEGTPPTKKPNDGDVRANGSGVVEGALTQLSDYEKMVEQLQRQMTTSQQQVEKQTGIVQKLMGQREDIRASQKSAQEMFKEARETALSEMGLKPTDIQKIGTLIGTIRDYNQQMADIQAVKQQQLITEEQAGMPNTYIQGRKALVERKYNAEISSIAAQAAVATQEMQMLQGAYQDARTTANQIVEAMTYDQQQLVDDIEWQIEMNADLLNLASQEEQQAWNRALTLAQQSLQEDKTRLTAVNNMMIDSKGQAGITINDTLEEATRKYNEWQQEQPGEERWQIVSRGGQIYRVSPDTGAMEKVGEIPGGETGLEGMPTSFKEWQLAGGAEGTGQTYSQWLQQTKGTDELTKNQQLTIDRMFISSANKEDGTINNILDTKGVTLSQVSQPAISQGVSFDGFKSALLSNPRIVINPDNSVWLKGGGWFARDKNIGNLDDIKDNFTSSPTTGVTSEELDDIMGF